MREQATRLTPRLTNDMAARGDPLSVFVDAVTDRVIDKLTRMELPSDSLAASLSPPKQPAAVMAAEAEVDADDHRIPMLDLKRNCVVLITLTARKPGPTGKQRAFRGTVHVNTNDVKLSKDVDDLLQAARKGSVMSDGADAVSDKGARNGAASASALEEEEGGLSPDSSCSNDSGPESADASFDKSAVATRSGMQAKGSRGSSGGGGNVGSSRDTSKGSAAEAGLPPEDQAAAAKKGSSRATAGAGAVQQRDPRGRKVGSTVSSKKLSSLETRLMERVLKLKHVIECNGYDFGQSQVMDQTEIARVTHGAEAIAFQRILIHCRPKTEQDASSSDEAALQDSCFSSPLTPV